MNSENKQKQAGRTMVLGVGNVAMADEGFGVHVIRRLKDWRFPENVSLKEGAVAGFDLLGSLEGIDTLLVVDVMIADLEPGEIGLVDLDSSLQPADKTNLSFHQVGMTELLQIAELIGHKPQVQFLVTQPEKMEWSFEMTEGVKKAVDKAVAFLAEKFGAEPPAGNG